MKAVRTALEFTAQHPSLRGHFPDNPIVPAVALLDAVLHLASTGASPLAAGTPPRWQIGNAKFHRPLRPGESVTLELQGKSDGSVHFTLSCVGARVAQGWLLAASDASAPAGAPLP